MKGFIKIIFYVMAMATILSLRESQAQVLLPLATLWDQDNCAGRQTTLVLNAPNLVNNGFDDQAKSATVAGSWLFYENKDFEGEMEFDFQPTQECSNFRDLGGKISSARLVGPVFNAYQNSLTLYSKDWFRGDDAKMFQNDEMDVGMNVVGSMIITGNMAWTLYSQKNFQGNSVCIGLEDYNPSFICESSMVFGSPVQSVKIGCHVNPKIVDKTNCNTGYD